MKAKLKYIHYYTETHIVEHTEFEVRFGSSIIRQMPLIYITQETFSFKFFR